MDRVDIIDDGAHSDGAPDVSNVEVIDEDRGSELGAEDVEEPVPASDVDRDPSFGKTEESAVAEDTATSTPSDETAHVEAGDPAAETVDTERMRSSERVEEESMEAHQTEGTHNDSLPREANDRNETETGVAATSPRDFVAISSTPITQTVDVESSELDGVVDWAGEEGAERFEKEDAVGIAPTPDIVLAEEKPESQNSPVRTSASPPADPTVAGTTSISERVKVMREVSASTKIQAVHRGAISRKRHTERVAALSAAATAMQRCQRGHRGRRLAGEIRREREVRLHEERSAALSVQVAVRGMLARHEVARRAQAKERSHAAAVQIQASYRGIAARRAVRLAVLEQDQAATMLQSVARGRMERRKFDSRNFRAAEEERVDVTGRRGHDAERPEQQRVEREVRDRIHQQRSHRGLRKSRHAPNAGRLGRLKRRNPENKDGTTDAKRRGVRLMRVVAQLVKANRRLREELKSISARLDSRLRDAKLEKEERDRLKREEQEYIRAHGEHPDAALGREIEAQDAEMERAHTELELLRRQNAKLKKKLDGAAANPHVLAQVRNQLAEKNTRLNKLLSEHKALKTVVYELQHSALESQRPIGSEFEKEIESLKEELSQTRAELRAERESMKMSRMHKLPPGLGGLSRKIRKVQERNMELTRAVATHQGVEKGFITKRKALQHLDTVISGRKKNDALQSVDEEKHKLERHFQVLEKQASQHQEKKRRQAKEVSKVLLELQNKASVYEDDLASLDERLHDATEEVSTLRIQLSDVQRVRAKQAGARAERKRLARMRAEEDRERHQAENAAIERAVNAATTEAAAVANAELAAGEDTEIRIDEVEASETLESSLETSVTRSRDGNLYSEGSLAVNVNGGVVGNISTRPRLRVRIGGAI